MVIDFESIARRSGFAIGTTVFDFDFEQKIRQFLARSELVVGFVESSLSEDHDTWLMVTLGADIAPPFGWQAGRIDDRLSDCRSHLPATCNILGHVVFRLPSCLHVLGPWTVASLATDSFGKLFGKSVF